MQRVEEEIKILKRVLFIICLILSVRAYADPVIDAHVTRDEALKNLNPNCPVEITKNQEVVDVLYYSFDGRIHKGQVVVDWRLANDIKDIFRSALEEKFPFQSVIPISDERFNWDSTWPSS